MRVAIPHRVVEAALFQPPRELLLVIEYDPQMQLVRRAEFLGVGSSDGTIRIELGAEGFDQALLDPTWWTEVGPDP